MFTRLLFPLIIVAAQPAARPVDKGWELRIELALPNEPVLAGEEAAFVVVKATMKNLTDRERGFVAPPRSIHRHVLEANLVQPDGKPPGAVVRLRCS